MIAPVSFFRAVFAFFFATFTSPFHRAVTDGDKAKNGHRHASHLYRLYPAAHIMPETPEIFATADNLAQQPTRQRLRSLSLVSHTVRLRYDGREQAVSLRRGEIFT